MKTKNPLTKHLPRAHTTFNILMALISPQDGNGIMKRVEEISENEVRLAPGTLYGLLNKLEKDGLIKKLIESPDQRRHHYQLTDFGKEMLIEELKLLRLHIDKCEQMIHSEKGMLDKH